MEEKEANNNHFFSEAREGKGGNGKKNACLGLLLTAVVGENVFVVFFAFFFGFFFFCF